jgi:hypothetical protein
VDYFILGSDQRISRPLQIQIPDSELKTFEPIGKRVAASQLRIDSFVEYVDYMSKPAHIFSDQMKKLMEIFVPELAWQPVFIQTDDSELTYWIPNINIHEDLLEESNERVKKIMVKEERLSGVKIIGIKTSRLDSIIAIRLDLAESILRRAFNGITLTKLTLV